MASYRPFPTCPDEGDSPLSIVASVLGILTSGSAVAATVRVCVNSILDANERFVYYKRTYVG